jgi:hypothetical protein
MLERVELDNARVELSIELGSDPIRGSVAARDGEPQMFSGWIELVAAIEDVRADRSPHTKTLGWLPGAKPQAG